VAEPEVEPEEDSGVEPEIEPADSAAAEREGIEAGCPVGMGYGDAHRCGRELHVAPDGADEKPVCLMHSEDPNKESGLLFDAFWREFERILEDAGESKAHFEHFVFPRLDFREREFQAICSFRSAKFKQNADFRNATFKQDVTFRNATFDQDADFLRATFTQGVRFVETTFHGTANWARSRFLDRAEFRRTKFIPRIVGRPSAAFSLASFSKPDEIIFEDVDLSRALFHNSDVSQVWFTSSVLWRNRDGNRGLAVFEETIPHDSGYAKGLEKNGQPNYRAVAQIYQQLKKNYDSRQDYWTANEFHFGEMEMKRLAEPTEGPFLQARQWLHRNLSLVALYRYASDYGNSYTKPIVWLLGILILFASLLPLPGVGLMRQGAKQTETYTSVWDVQKSYGEDLWAEVCLVGNGAITSVDAATFQKGAEYAPAYPLGRVLAIFETLLTSSLFALFLLAIRRQFRR